jgi:hypothetical protein
MLFVTTKEPNDTTSSGIIGIIYFLVAKTEIMEGIPKTKAV